MVLYKNVGGHLMLYLAIILAVTPAFLAASTCCCPDPDVTEKNDFLRIGNQQLEVGKKNAPLRKSRDKTKTLAQSVQFLSTTGGVAFEAVAVPAPDLKDQPVQLDYVPDEQDGQRISITIGDKSYHPFLPDWKLIPIARYADSEFESAVSALNSPENQAYTELLYHPAFEASLLGLRLLQMDLLLSDIKAFQELPKNSSGRLITGVGEPKNAIPPQSRNNKLLWKLAIKKFSGYLENNDERIGADARWLMSSWLKKTSEKLWKSTQEAFSTSLEEYNFKFPAQLISNVPLISNEQDWENEKRIFLDSDEGRIFALILLRINEPSINTDDEVWQVAVSISLDRFYEWFLEEYPNTMADIDELQSYVVFLIDFTTSVDGGALMMTDYQVEVQFSVDDKSFFQLSGFPYYYFWEEDQEFEKLKKEAEHCKKETDLEAALRCGSKLQQAYDGMKVDEKTHLIQFMKEQRELIRAFNPTVYDATVETMRYAAFFRYVKQNHKDSWDRFLRQLESVKITPMVKTPTRWKR